MILAVMIAVGAAIVVALRLGAWRRMLELARAGTHAKAEAVSPDDLNPRQSELLVQMQRLGFTVDTPFRVLLDDKDPGIYASARGLDDTAWFRSLAIEGHDLSGLSLLTYFPGGRLVSASSASHAVDPTEVVQCIPDAAPGKLLSLHEDALAALAARGVHPRSLPAVLLPLVEEEWHDEVGVILAKPLLSQIWFSRTFWSVPRPTLPVSSRPEVDEIASLLRGRS